jgi:hypothetical protein
MTIDKKVIAKRALPVLAGAGLGFAYYYFIGCSTSSCPISSNPYVSTLYGALVGFLVAMPSKKKTAGNGTDNQNS